MGFLHDKRVVVTGGAGFLGREVCAALQAYEPAMICAPRSREFDLRRPLQIVQMMRSLRPDVVIHLAAVVGGIGANRRHPGKFFYENAIMGVELIEQCRRFDVQKTVLAGTICSYPKHTSVPFREEDLWLGYPEETNAAYGLAKKMLLVQAQAYRQEYGMSAITLLPVNLYGPGDNFDPRSSHVIPALIRKALEAAERGDDALDVWGTGAAAREFLYVKDAARAFAAAAEHYDGGEPVNIGSGEEITIKELATRISELCGFRGRLNWQTDKPDGQLRRKLNTQRAATAFGFRAETDLEEGLRDTIAWYRTARRAARLRAA